MSWKLWKQGGSVRVWLEVLFFIGKVLGGK
jgi:hypothetical protein